MTSSADVMSRCCPHPSEQEAAIAIDDFLTSKLCAESLLDGLHRVAIKQTKMLHDVNFTNVLYTDTPCTAREQTCTNAPAGAATGRLPAVPFATSSNPHEIPEFVDLSSLQSRTSSVDALDIFVGPEEGVKDGLPNLQLLPDFMLADDANLPRCEAGPVLSSFICQRQDSNLSSCSTVAATCTTATSVVDQWLATFPDDDDDDTDLDTVEDVANVADKKVQSDEPQAPESGDPDGRSIGVLEDYCRIYMRMGVSEIKPIVLVRILDLSRLFRCVSAQGFVEMLAGKGVNSLFGFQRLVVHKPVEFTLAITSMLNGWNCQRLHPPRFSLFTELLRLLGIHPKRSSRVHWREELPSVLHTMHDKHGHFLMYGEFVFSLARMRKNCLRLRRRN